MQSTQNIPSFSSMSSAQEVVLKQRKVWPVMECPDKKVYSAYSYAHCNNNDTPFQAPIFYDSLCHGEFQYHKTKILNSGMFRDNALQAWHYPLIPTATLCVSEKRIGCGHVQWHWGILYLNVDFGKTWCAMTLPEYCGGLSILTCFIRQFFSFDEVIGTLWKWTTLFQILHPGSRVLAGSWALCMNFGLVRDNIE